MECQVLFQNLWNNINMKIKFNERLKELRLEKGLTQLELSKILNIGRSSIGEWENMRNEPSLEMLVKIARFFGVTTDYLLGIEDYEEI